MDAAAGPEEVQGFLPDQPSNDLLSQAMGKFTIIESRVLLARNGAPLMPALKKILTNDSCDFEGMKQLIEAASGSPTEEELRYCMSRATWEGDLSAVQFLIGKGAPVAGITRFDWVKYQGREYHNPNLFTCAILSGNREMVALFLQLDPAVFNQTYGRNADQHDSALLANKKMMALNVPETSFAALSERSKAALLSHPNLPLSFLEQWEAELQAELQAELKKGTFGSEVIMIVSSAFVPVSGLLGLMMYTSSPSGHKAPGLVLLGLAALALVVGVATAVSTFMHNRKCEQLSSEKKELTNRITELENQKASQPSAKARKNMKNRTQCVKT
jgi:outer membrane murein-binding lipoprotein Lpp